jgi:hypothetical protein
VHPELAPDQDFIAFDEATGESIGRACIEHHSANVGRWHWSMFAHSTTGKVPFDIHGHEDSRGAAGRRVVEAYERLLEHNARYPRGIVRDPDDPRTLSGPGR